MAMSRLSAIRTMSTQLLTAEANCQASRFFSLVSSSVKVGIKADPNAPPATRLKSVSATRLAALKASISRLVPKASATRIWRISPASWLKAKAAMTKPAARAICRPAEGVSVLMGGIITETGGGEWGTGGGGAGECGAGSEGASASLSYEPGAFSSRRSSVSDLPSFNAIIAPVRPKYYKLRKSPRQFYISN